MTKGKRHLSPSQKWVSALSLLTLTLGAGNLGQAAMALHYAARLPDLPMTTSWTYLATTGGFWGITFIVCTIGLLRLRRWGRWATLATVTLHQMHTWLNRLLFDASDYAIQTRPRDLLLTMLLLALYWGSLNLPGVQKAFGDPSER